MGGTEQTATPTVGKRRVDLINESAQRAGIMQPKCQLRWCHFPLRIILLRRKQQPKRCLLYTSGTSAYEGGGLNQGGTYSKQTWTVRMIDPTHLSTSNGDYAATWTFVNGDEVNTVFGPVTLTDLQRGC